MNACGRIGRRLFICGTTFDFNLLIRAELLNLIHAQRAQGLVASALFLSESLPELPPVGDDFKLGVLLQICAKLDLFHVDLVFDVPAIVKRRLATLICLLL